MLGPVQGTGPSMDLAFCPSVLAAIETNIAANFCEDERKPTTGPQCECIRKILTFSCLMRHPRSAAK